MVSNIILPLWAIWQSFYYVFNFLIKFSIMDFNFPQRAHLTKSPSISGDFTSLVKVISTYLTFCLLQNLYFYLSYYFVLTFWRSKKRYKRQKNCIIESVGSSMLYYHIISKITSLSLGNLIQRLIKTIAFLCSNNKHL